MSISVAIWLTLRFSLCSASAKVNEVFDESTLLRQYREEIVKLKRELAAAREANLRLAKIPTSESNDGSDTVSRHLPSFFNVISVNCACHDFIFYIAFIECSN
jgi:hypothetical protein